MDSEHAKRAENPTAHSSEFVTIRNNYTPFWCSCGVTILPSPTFMTVDSRFVELASILNVDTRHVR